MSRDHQHKASLLTLVKEINAVIESDLEMALQNKPNMTQQELMDEIMKAALSLAEGNKKITVTMENPFTVQMVIDNG